MALAIQIHWDDHFNLKIIDVHEKIHEKVNKFMVKYFRCCEIFKVLKILEEPGIEDDLQKILKHILENDCSIVVVDKENDEIQAVALLKWMSAEWRSWTALRLLIDSERLKELCEMVTSCMQQHALKNQDAANGDSLHLFSYHLHEELEENECFRARFFNAIYEVARHMHMPRVTYMCLSNKKREIIQKAGFEEIVRIIYSMYIYKGRRPFDRLRDINEMYGGLYEKKVEPIIPYNTLIIRHEAIKESKDTKDAKE